MQKLVKTLAVFGAVIVAGAGLSGQAMAQYSCSNAIYGSGSGTYNGTYSQCSANNTSNQASTVATSNAVLKVAAGQSARLIGNRIAGAFGSDSPNMQVSANGFTASTGMAAGDMNGKAGLWVSGSLSDVEDENDDTEFDGNIYNTLIGADYQLSSNTVVGIAVGYENIDIDTQYNGFGGNDGNLDGDGYTIAPYVGFKLGQSASADLTVGYSSLDYDTLRYDPVTGNSITGDTEGERYFINAALNGDHKTAGNWHLRGRTSVFYASEDKDGYTETESTGATIAVDDDETELGQFLVDARFGYMFNMMEPYALAGIEYDFAKDGQPVAAGQTESMDDDFGAKFGGGLDFHLSPNLTGGVEAYTVEFRDDYNEYNVTGGVRLKF